MPWQEGASKVAARVHPAPNAYDTSQYSSIASTRSPHSAKSAAFASTSDRFAKVKPAAGDGGSYTGGSLGMARDRPSAAFASTSKRLPSRATPSPGPVYNPREAQTAVKDPGHLSHGLASTSARRLPFDTGSRASGGVAATRYSPSTATSVSARGRADGFDGDTKSGVPSKGAAALGFTSPRFTIGHYNHARRDGPGPGTYEASQGDPRTLGSAASTSARRLPASTEERTLVWEKGYRTPGADAYSPRASKLGVGDLGANAHIPSAAFSSSSQRLRPHATLSPGPGAYAPEDGLATASGIASAATGARTVRRSASFGSSSTRFRPPKSNSPGPGAYVDDHRTLASPRQTTRVSASFASGSERTQLPLNHKDAAKVPAPGAHGGHDPPTSGSARVIRRSASFASTSTRLKGPSRAQRDTPPPGAYDPALASRGRALASATQKYSIHRLA